MAFGILLTNLRSQKYSHRKYLEPSLFYEAPYCRNGTGTSHCALRLTQARRAAVSRGQFAIDGTQSWVHRSLASAMTFHDALEPATSRCVNGADAIELDIE